MKNTQSKRFFAVMALVVALLLLALTALAFTQGEGPTQQELDKADNDPDNWLMYNKGYSGQRYSALTQLTSENAGELRPVCAYQLGETGAFQTGPVVYKGVMYITGTYATVALDAATCKVLWRYDYSPTGPEPINTNRGVALFEGTVIRGTTDAHLIALEAKSGKLLWDSKVLDSTQGYFISAAPIAWNGLVLVGTGGADWGANGEMYAFDIKTGKQVWKFDLIPTGNERGAETWQKAESTTTGGGSTWTSYALDTETGLLYIPVGNPAPDFAPQYRPGDNLFTNSTVVLEAKTGKLSHYYQQVPNDGHDWDTSAAPLLMTLNGTRYVVQGNKEGYLYVYDEQTQKLAYKAQVTTVTNADTPPTTDGVYACPGDLGGVEWNGPAYDPEQNALFVATVDWCGVYKLGETRYVEGQFFFGGTLVPDPVSKAKGWIYALDAANGQVLWKYQAPTPLVAAVTPTAGGVLLSGDLSGNFNVMDAKSSKLLYQFNTGGAVAGGIITYTANDKQYVAVASGNASRTIWSTTGSATMFVFALTN